MQPIKYKDHDITFNEISGKFGATINSRFQQFLSLKSVRNAIDKNAVTDFKPIECINVEDDGYRPTTYKMKKIKIIGYEENKRFRSNHLKRFYKVSDGHLLSIRDAQLFDLKDLKQVEANIREINRLAKIQEAAEKKVEKLDKQRGKMAVSYDPHPELD